MRVLRGDGAILSRLWFGQGGNGYSAFKFQAGFEIQSFFCVFGSACFCVLLFGIFSVCFQHKNIAGKKPTDLVYDFSCRDYCVILGT
jgi:hypothetical protein